MEMQTALFEQSKEELQVIPDLESYDLFIVAFSGGKDSTASFLYLLDQGVEPGDIELWHHNIDGREGEHFMDWPCTPAYCQAFADAFGVDYYESWKKGGFERELLRENKRTAPTCFETPEGISQKGGQRGKKLTRREFPATSGIHNGRWCSAILKIDVGDMALRNQERLRGKKVLFITGERGQESSNRAKYKQLEPHSEDRRNGKRVKRHIDHWRPLIHWKEKHVWEIIKDYKVRVHPAYYLGWGRLSCAFCIFGNPNQWASGKKVLPEQYERIKNYEDEFGKTIKYSQRIGQIPIEDMADRGTPYPATENQRLIEQARSEEYTEDIIMEKIIEGIRTSTWEEPAGAYGEMAGPS